MCRVGCGDTRWCWRWWIFRIHFLEKQVAGRCCTGCIEILCTFTEIWDEVGESDEERDKMLLQIEQECVKRIEEESGPSHMSRAHLLQALADAKLELSTLLASPVEKKVCWDS
ncbi:putative microtubule-associated protein, MAP65/Ase1/PRC1 [Helianthus anomalus]